MLDIPIRHKEFGGWMWWNYYVLMCESGKMRHVETISGMGGIKENDGGGEFNYKIF
jgi:hypothetical protein